MDLSKAFSLIREFEGLSLKAYRDAVGVWTIGYGTTQNVHPGMVITKDQAESLMEEDVKERAQLIATWLTHPVSDNQMSAMISLAYNIGMQAFHRSKLLVDLNAGKSKWDCAHDFMSWTHAGGQVLKGLVVRRTKEAQVFVS